MKEKIYNISHLINIGRRSIWVVFCLLLIFLRTAQSDSVPFFAQHGMFWGGSLLFDSAIVENGVWQGISGSALNISLSEKRTVVLSYDMTVQALRGRNGNPLPREGQWDALQVRCLVDGVPFRHGSAYALNYGVEATSYTKLSSILAIDLSASGHRISLEWKKVGQQIEEWRIATGAVNAAFSIVAEADFDAVFPLMETRDVYLPVSQVWKPLTSPLTFTLLRDRNVTISYAFSVQPQLLSFIMDRNMEYVNTRLVLDGLAYTESGEVFGSNSWNPQASSIRGDLRLPLTAGQHTVLIEWKKVGNVFRGWASNPSFLDGFAAARNLIVTVEKFASGEELDSRVALRTSEGGQWSIVGNSSLELFLFKESAVLIRYALPISQHANPNLDANAWQPLAQLQCRLVVDGIGYSYRGGAETTGSRRLSDLFGQLALILPAGRHHVELQWRSDGVSWMTLNNLDGGFLHGEKLLTFISSANAQPRIDAPDKLVGLEGEDLRISSISISDVDAELQPGMRVSVNLTVTWGVLQLFNQPFFSSNSSSIFIQDSVGNINAALNGMVYSPFPLWNGEDSLQIFFSDEGNVGYSSALTANRSVMIIVEAVDNPFTLSTPTFIQAGWSDSIVVPVRPIVLHDVDSQQSNFTVQFSTTCGLLSIGADMLNNLQIEQNDSTASGAFVSFQGLYPFVVDALAAVNYTPYSFCNKTLHAEIIVLTVINNDNLNQNITRLISLDVMRPPVLPVVDVADYPRWHLQGIGLAGTSDLNPDYYYSYSDGSNGVAVNASLRTYLASSPEMTPSMSEILWLRSESMNYTFSVVYDYSRVNLLSSSYILPGKTHFKYVQIAPDLADNSTSQLFCELQNVTTAALLTAPNIVQCIVSTDADSTVDSTVLLRIVGRRSGQNFQTGYLSLHVVAVPVIETITPNAIIAGVPSTIRLRSASASIITQCLVDEETVVNAFLVNEDTISCQLLDLASNKTSLMIAVVARDRDICSESYILPVYPSILVENASLSHSNIDGSTYVVLRSSWTTTMLNSFTDVSCIVLNQRTDASFITASGDVFCPALFDQSKLKTCRLLNNCVSAISIGGYESQGTPLTFDNFSQVTSDASLEDWAFLVDSVPVLAGQTVTLVAPHVDKLVNTICEIDDSQSIAIMESSYALLCPIPSNISQGIKTLRLLDISGSVFFTSNITINSFPLLISYSPSQAFVSGGQDLTLVFNSALPQGPLQCLIDGSMIPALLLSTSSLSCTLPPRAAAGSAVVNLLFGNALVPNVSLSLNYLEITVVEHILPTAGSALGGTRITVYGSGFRMADGQGYSLLCFFGEMPASAIVRSEQEVECVSPPAAGVGVVEFSLQTSERLLSSRIIQFEYTSPMIIKQPSPCRASARGGEVIQVEGFNFPMTSDLLCIFGDVAMEALFLSSNMVQCITPMYSAIPVEFRLMLLTSGDSSNAQSFQFVDAVAVKDVYPTSVVRHTFTSFRIIGGPFLAADQYSCSIGQLAGQTKLITSELVACEGIITQSSSQFEVLNFFVNGHSLASFQFEVLPSTGSISISPALLDINREQIITISASGLLAFQNSSFELACMFGEDGWLSSTIFVNATTAVCMTPIRPFPMQEFLKLSLGGHSSTVDSILLRYVEPILVMNILPVEGYVTGGEVVVIRGVGFVPFLNASCYFGSQSVSAEWLDESSFECIAPSASLPGIVPFQIAFEGYSGGSANDLHYNYLPLPVVYAMYPGRVPQWTAVQITVIGDGFSPSQNYSCRLNGTYLETVYVNSTCLLCSFSPFLPGNYSLEILGQESNLPSAVGTDLVLQVVDALAVTRISPSFSFLNNDQILTVEGLGFFAINSTLFCRFGDVQVAASVANDSILFCNIPPSSSTGTVIFQLVTSLYDLPAQTYPIHYLPSPLISALKPSFLREGSREGLLVSGEHFPNMPISCHYNTSQVSAKLINSSSLICPQPMFPQSMRGQQLFLSLTFGEVSCLSWNEPVLIVPPAKLQYLSSSYGWAQGDSGLTITLSEAILGFDQTILCSIDNRLSSAILLNQSAVRCFFTNAIAGVHLVSLSVDGFLLEGLPYTALPTPVAHQIFPTGSLVPGSLLHVAGIFPFSSSLHCTMFCSFGGFLSEGSVLNDNELQCPVPQLAVMPNVAVVFSLQCGDLIVNTSISISFASQPVVYGVKNGLVQLQEISPTFLIYGAHFSSAGSVWCFVGDGLSAAFVVNETAIDCTLPPFISPGAYEYGIQMLETKVYGPGALKVFPSCRVDSISPLLATDEDVTVQIKGEGFYNAEDIIVRFGDFSRSPGIFVDNYTILAVPTAAPRGKVEVSVFLNDVRCSIGSQSFYQAQDPPIIEKITPEVILVGERTIVLIDGSSILHYQQYVCNFGNSSWPATVTSGDKLTCVVTMNATMRGEFFIAMHTGLSNSLQFAVINPILEGIDQLIINARGGDWLAIAGAALPLHVSLNCVFGGEQVTKGRVVNETMALCETPYFDNTSTVNVELDFRGCRLFAGTVLALKMPLIVDITPRQLSAVGGTVVNVSVTEVIVVDTLRCLFGDGDHDVTTALFDSNTVYCQTPSMLSQQLSTVSLVTGPNLKYDSLSGANILQITDPPMIMQVYPTRFIANSTVLLNIEVNGLLLEDYDSLCCNLAQGQLSKAALADFNNTIALFACSLSIPAIEKETLMEFSILYQMSATLFTSHLIAVPEAISTGTSPYWSVVNNSVVVNFFGGVFAVDTSLLCLYDGEFSDALVLSPTQIQCSIKPTTIGTVEVTLQSVSQQRQLATALVDILPSVKLLNASRLGDNLLLFELGETGPELLSLRWSCSVQNLFFPASLVSVNNASSLAYCAITKRVPCSTCEVRLVGENEFISISSDVVYSIVMDDLMSASQSSAPSPILGNGSTSALQAIKWSKLIQQISDQVSINFDASISHERQGGFLSTDLVSLFSSAQMHYQCNIGGDDCHDWNEYSNLTNGIPGGGSRLDNLKNETMVDLRSSNQSGMLMMDRVEPLILKSDAATWVTVQGFDFDYLTRCVVQNQTIVMTILLSDRELSCLVPPFKDSQSPVIALTLVGGNAGRVTTGQILLTYDILLNGVFQTLDTQTFGDSDEDWTVDNGEVMLQSELCIAKWGCETVSNTLNGISITDGKHFPQKLELNRNTSTWVLNTSSFQTEDDEFSFSSKRILSMKPTKLFTSCRNCLVNFLSDTLQYGELWCMLIQQTQVNCVVRLSGSILSCPLPSQLPPGRWKVEVLSDCSDVVFVDTLEIGVDDSLVDTQWMEENHKAASSVHLILPTVLTVEPRYGFVSGGTLLHISLSTKLSGQYSCLFWINRGGDLPDILETVAFWRKDNTLSCLSPQVDSVGSASLYLALNDSLLATNHIIDFISPPLLYAAIVVSDDSSSLLLSGAGFKSFTMVFCKLVYKDTESRTIIVGNVINDVEAVCNRSSVNTTGLLACSVSFDGFDYLPFVNVTILAPSVQGIDFDASNESASLQYVSAVWQMGDEIAETFLSCEQANYVSFRLPYHSVDANYSCLLDDVEIGPSILSTTQLAVCMIPSIRPGSYGLTLVSNLQKYPPQRTIVHCTVDPRITSLYAMPQVSKEMTNIVIRGAHFDYNLQMQCLLDFEVSTAQIDSDALAQCKFYNAIPGNRILKIMLSNRVIYNQNICLDKDMILDGGSISSTVGVECLSVVTEVKSAAQTPFVRQNSAITYSIRSITPNHGLTTGYGQVTVIADLIHSKTSIACIFGTQVTDGLVVDRDTVVCNTPAAPVGNVSMSLVSLSEPFSWCCGWYFYHEQMAIDDVHPAVINGIGDSLINLRVSGLPYCGALYCHISGSEIVIAASSINSSHLSCLLPPVQASQVRIGVGTSSEIWTNQVHLLILQEEEKAGLRPQFGSLLGNTSVLISFPRDLFSLDNPLCIFGSDIIRPQAFDSSQGKIICITNPQVVPGRVDVFVRNDDNAANSPAFFVGEFTFQAPAEVLSISPAFCPRGENTKIIVYGAYFADLAGLSCVLDGTTIVAARWLSGDTITCDIPATATFGKDSITVQATNNGYDLSKTVIQLPLTNRIEIVETTPNKGFTRGGTQIQIIFRYPLAVRLYCVFSGYKVLGIRLHPESISCLTPSHENAAILVDVTNDAGDSFGSFSFTFLPPPALSLSPDTKVLRNISSSVVFYSNSEIPSSTAVRFRYENDGSFVRSSTCFTSKPNELICEDILIDRAGEYLLVDITVNDKDYVSSAITVPVVEPSQLEWIDPLYARSSGNSTIKFGMDRLYRGRPIMCLFASLEDRNATRKTVVASVRAQILEKNILLCESPPLSLTAVNELEILEYGNTIFGPVPLIVVEVPCVARFSHPTVVLGIPQKVIVVVDYYIPIFPNMELLINNDIFPLVMVNGTAAFAYVQINQPGKHNVYLIQDRSMQTAIEVGVMNVSDMGSLFSFDVESVVRAKHTIVNVQFSTCSVESTLHCMLDKGNCVVLRHSSCALQVSIVVEANISVAKLSICSEALCLRPIVMKTISVLSPATLVVINPSYGPSIGGVLTTLYGDGFVDDASIMCLFGRKPSSAVILNSTMLQCISPAHEAGVVEVNIERQGTVISTSTARFEYISLLSLLNVSSSVISSQGGTILTVLTEAHPHYLFYECRFNEKYVPAVVMGDSKFQCEAPAFDVDVVSFAISTMGSDISVEQFLTIAHPLYALHVEPVTLTPLQDAVVTVLFDRILTVEMDPICLVDDRRVMSMFEGDTLFCDIESLESGQHSLVVLVYGVPVFRHSLDVRPHFDISSVFPTTSFSSQSVIVTLTSAQASTSNEYSWCCFAEHRTPAALLSTNQWQCYSPVLPSENLYRLTTLEIGLARQDGFCEYSGILFYSVPPVQVASIEPQQGPIVGGTSYNVSTKQHLLMDQIYCSLGGSIVQGHYNGAMGIHCLTSPSSRPGSMELQLSVNGRDFMSTGLYFSFTLPVPYVTTMVGSDGDSSLSPPPLVFWVSIVSFPVSLPTSTIVTGRNFAPDSLCMLSGEHVVLTEYVSSTELICVMPVHIPGTDTLFIVNSDAQRSSPWTIQFVGDPALSTGKSAVSPQFGPRNGNTLLTVSGQSLDKIEGQLYCIIGEEWVLAFSIKENSVQCTAPPSKFAGLVNVQLSNSFGEMLPEAGLFEYIEPPQLYDVQPRQGVPGTEVVVVGKGFSKYSSLSAIFGADPPCLIQSDSKLICTVPDVSEGDYNVYLITSEQHTVSSGMTFTVVSPVRLLSLWPLNGPAFRGGTILSINGSNFSSSIDIFCLIDGLMVPAFVRSDQLAQCRTPAHRPGLVKISLLGDGIPLHPLNQSLDFLYVADISVDKITPEFGYTAGEFPVIVFGSNFLNTTSLGCMFGDMKSRGIFLSKDAILCLSPSPLGRPLLADLDNVPVEVTVNGFDYSQSNISFAYSQPCDKGFFCPGMTRQLCPNGTYCPENSRNFTLCEPGYFQPMQGQELCVICPIGYICPDMGMPRPIICPAGLICDVMGLRASTKLCPAGRYCLNGTKASSVDEFESSQGWVEDYVTGVVYFNSSQFNYSYTAWPAPAVGQSRPQAPPEASCDGMVCEGGTTNVLAEAPFPCPIGHYCRAGAVTQIPMPKNFSSPQRCFDGFFCPRGSVSPEGSGPCPNGYFCPTQMDAIICPAGHHCPGVGNTNPIECYPGTYNPFEGKANCTVCPTGHICPGWGLFLPELCPAGFVCMSLGLSFPVALCPQGYYCEEGTLTLDPSDPTSKKPKVCKEGQFCLGGVSNTINVEWIPSQPYGASHPQLCSEGTYCQAGAYLSSGSGLCFEGHYCPPNSSWPIETPVGNYASGLGSVAPTLCYPGTYAPLKAQVDCLTCPAGHTCTSYGTYVPTICSAGTYRSLIDSVTCTNCPTGTYSNFVGAPDITLCLPCPKGRICGTKQMITLASSSACPAGYICGYGTDRSNQFTHLTPAGFHTATESTPDEQFDSQCVKGYYCQRGTPTYLQYGGKCAVGYYCPQATPSSTAVDVKCPQYTTSLSGLDTLQGCRISEVNVCDKSDIDSTNPMEDITYYPTFTYTLLDDSGTNISFNSSTSATNPTGEIRTVAKIHPLNESYSSPTWVNDTVEAFRACPLYGSGTGGDVITIIGRNFLDNDLNFCKFRACISANKGANLRRCKNQIKSATGDDLPKAGVVSNATFITPAKFISSTRIECITPPYIFDAVVSPTIAENGYTCMFLDAFGNEVNSTAGNYSFVRECSDSTSCANKPSSGLEFYITLTFTCSTQDSTDGTCTNTPEPGYMFNPCMSAEMLVEVTNDGEHYSGGDELQGTFILSTVRYGDGGTIYDNFKNYSRNATFAVYTYVHQQYFYNNSEIMDMERSYCLLPRYSEEAVRQREKGWYLLELQEVAHVQIDLSHLPSDLVYGQHYSIAIFVQPSRCKSELCSSARVRLSPEEYLPCRLPVDFSYWFQQTTVPKNVVNNITIYALDDVLFKVEVHLLYGLLTAYAPLFENTTVVRVVGPSRAKSFEGRSFGSTKTRTLSPYVSFQEQRVTLRYFFCAVVYQTDSDSVSQPLNLPPLYSDYQRGRVLIMNNVSADNNDVPLILDNLDDVDKGVNFWLMPATTAAESKELLDAYFETFQDTTYDSLNGYQFDFTTLLIGYLPYFSNCYGYDSYIPIWMLLESEDCELPDTYADDWFRYKYPALPDQDDIRFVGPFDFFEDPIADWCTQTIQCNYEEDLTGQDNTPRWFELATDSSLFQFIRVPMNYFDYTGRAATTVSQDDQGGGAIVASLAAVSGDNFISVNIDHSIGDALSGCVLQCFARSYTLTITYYQEDFYNKRIIKATLAGDQYDFNQTRTDYELNISFYALSFLDLILNFAFPLSIFIVLFCFVGFLVIFFAFLGWAVTRATTLLQNPPQLKFISMLALTVPPPLAGVTMAVTGIWILTSMGNYFINGYFFTNPNSPSSEPVGTLYLDSNYPLQYGQLGSDVSSSAQQNARYGRMGAVFFIVGFCCFMIASKMYFPREESRREREVAKKRTELAKKHELWDPVLWKKANFMFTSFVLGTFLTLIIELSYWTEYGDTFYQVMVLLTIFGEVVGYFTRRQLNDEILVAPLDCGYEFIKQLIGFGSPDFYAFISQNFMDFAVSSFQRIFQDTYINYIFSTGKKIALAIYSYIKSFLPKYLTGGKQAVSKEDEENAKDYRKRAVEGVAEAEDESESVEPILEYLSEVSSDAMVVVYFPFFVYILMQYRETVQIPVTYGIRQSDMMIYLVYQLFYVAFQPIIDIFNHSQCELFHGWKIYEYLVYSRYRFLQRETRWKGMESNLDECIEEGLRRLDQMCFSSQYFLMLTFQVNGIIFITLSYEVWLYWTYSPFSDSAFFVLLGYMLAIYLALRWIVFWLAVKLKVYRIKHENTAWHLIAKEEDDLDVPAWEEIKGASTEAFLMNQRITSETFRYKFLNYNRTWLINQLPQLLTPRTLRRSRPYLLNQLARIINARRDDISSDSDGEGAPEKKFGPVALTAPSRDIIRYWLGRARRRLRLRNIVEPLIKRARGAQCERCLSRKQLQIEYEVDVDQMAAMYDRAYPGDEEVDAMQWKTFWMANQRYHTICLACLTQRKETEARERLQGQGIGGWLDDDAQEAYPDWGPVFLSASSKAILLDWYRRAQKLRAAKRRSRPGGRGNRPHPVSQEEGGSAAARRRKERVLREISDDEGEEDEMFSWLRQGMQQLTPASKAIAIKWMRTARARLQQKRGKGAGLRETELDALEEAGAAKETFRSGRKSKLARK